MNKKEVLARRALKKTKRKVEIIGGCSDINMVEIKSPDFVSRARYHPKSSLISVKVCKKHFSFSGFSWCSALVPVIIVSLATSIYNFFSIPFSFTGLMLLSIIYFRFSIASWHGAEHKVIEAYEQAANYSFSRAKQTSPIAEKCGSRLAVFLVYPFFITFDLMVTLDLSLEWFLILVILWSLFFLTNKKACRVDLPDLTSRCLQRIFLTREPSKKELLTAHCALIGLLMAHEIEVNKPRGANFVIKI